MKATVLIGGQYGSEGKGAIAAAIANYHDGHIRVGGPNAGHTYYAHGRKWVGRSLPVGWINPEAKLFVGPGAVVDVALLESEIRETVQFGDVYPRLFVDPAATVLTPEQHAEEGGVTGEAHRRIGSTGEGVGIARRARLMRGAEPHVCVRDLLNPNFMRIESRMMMEGCRSMLVEGTQGSGLSLVHGPWPFCTSADTNAAGIIAECGISPLEVSDIIMVIRTYPIRVAGNSGPMRREITWEELSTRTGMTLIERTTVTKKVRRVSEFDLAMFLEAVELNKPTQIAITFMDYIDPTLQGTNDWATVMRSGPAKQFIDRVEEIAWPAKVTMVGTGGPMYSVAMR